MARPAAVGPTRVQRLLQDRSVRLAAGMAIAVAIPVAILFYFQFRSLHALEDTSKVVLRQLSQETVNDLTKQVEQALKAPHIGVLLRITQGRTEPLDLPFIESVFAENLRQIPFIDTFYAWSETDDEVPGQVLALDRAQLASLPAAGPAAVATGAHLRRNPPERTVLVDQLHELAKKKWAIVAVQMPIGGRTKYVQAQLRFKNPATRDHLSSFVAFATDPERLRQQYFPALMRERLAKVPNPQGFTPLVASVLDESGHVVFTSSRVDRVDHYVDEREFPLIFFDKELLQYAVPFETHREIWRLRTGYGAQTIPEIARANVMPQIRMMGFLAVVMAAGVFFVARGAAREVRLAELKSNFVSSVSHDLKTPLALIQLFAETLELGRVKTTDRAQEYYRIINSEARKLTRLINNILDFSRIEAGLRMYRMAPLDLAGLVRRVVTSLDSHFNQHNFTVTVTAIGDLPPVTADGEAVAQALENLLSNAMKYSPSDRRIEVQVVREDGVACVKVIDHGVGVPRTLQRKIFRKFYRVETDNFGPQGSGLGLAIVDHIMRAHRGQVRVDSEPGQGSTFTLCFKLDEGASAATDAEPARRAS